MTPGKSQTLPPVNNTRTIARNSFWYGLELATTFALVLGASIPMARIIGPSKLGYFNYVMWLANVTGAIGSLGIPGTTRKYMAEFLGKGEGGVARAIFFYTFRTQALLATLITAVALTIVIVFGDPAHRLVSILQVASTLPSMAGFVPAQANTATENMKANVFGSVLANFIQLIGVWVSLWFGWDLVGIATAILLARSTEFMVRVVPVVRWVKKLPEGPLPQAVRLRMRSFSASSTVLMLLNIVVWDRSDIIFLKMLSSNIAEVTFFSLAFNLTEKVMLAPQVFGQAVGATVLAQHGRDHTRVSQMVSTAVQYMLLCALPLLMGMAALSPAIIRMLYSWQYTAAIPVLAVAALFAIPKPMLLPAQHFLQANERQGFLIGWSCFCGAVNCALDYLLIPKYGALGAAIANGVGQTLAVGGIWVMVWHKFRIDLEVGTILKIVMASSTMALSVFLVTRNMPPVAGVAIGVPLGAVIFLGALRLTRTIRQKDRARLLTVVPSIPLALRPLFVRFVGLLAPEVLAARMDHA